MSLYDKILQAKKRQQPYINLTNHKHQISEVFDNSNIDAYKKIDLKSLYFRVGKLVLSKEFAYQITKLVEAGIREVFVFCDQASELTKEAFSNFFKEHKIYINLRVAQLSETDIEKIQEDSIGKKDILGFSTIDGYKLVYSNNWTVPLLNSIESDSIILDNHQSYKRELAEAFEFGVKEPNYIQNSNNSEVRATKFINSKQAPTIEAQLQLEVSQNIDVDLSVNQEVTQENELDIDQDQLANKFNLEEAYQYVNKKLKSTFHDRNLTTVPRWGGITNFSYEYTNKIFSSDSTIKYITKDALNLMIPHWNLFQSGINVNNMPIGLAVKDGIIFASEERPSSMPINEFTVNLNYVVATVSNPLQYSWLYYASKGSISLSDLYGSEDAPRMEGEEDHPNVKWGSGDFMLDIPYNHYCAKYTIIKKSEEPNCARRESPSFVSNPAIEIHNDMFPKVFFFNLSNTDRQRLRDIWQKLKERNIEDVFVKILLSSGLNDGGFLLEEKAAVFLDKLFYEIMPLPRDNDKYLFFKEILSLFSQPSSEDDKEKIFLLEDVFEALDAAYKKFQGFLVAEEINEDQWSELNNKFQAILKKQLVSSTSYKVAASRIISILELNSKNGGNLTEQLEYLDSAAGQKLSNDPNALASAEQLGLNIVHSSIDFTKYIDLKKPQIHPSIFVDIHTSPIYSFDMSLRYLASIAPHQRASIDSYIKSFESLRNVYLSLTNRCSSRTNSYGKNDIIQPNLQTAEYITSNLIKHNIQIRAINENFQSIKLKIFWTTEESFNTDSRVYFLIQVLDGKELQVAFYVNGQKHLVNFDDKVVGIKEYAISFIRRLQQANSDKNFGELSIEDEELGYFIQHVDFEPLGIEKLIEQEDPVSGLSLEDNEIYIGFDGKNFKLFKSAHDGIEEVDKSTIKLPDNLGAKIQEWDQNHQQTNFISFSYQEIQGTCFESQTNLALHNAKNFLIEQADGDFDKLTKNLQATEKNTIIDRCYADIGVVAERVNLVNNFTTTQALENLRLFVLNSVLSTGHYYDLQYPDQEFSSYISLFSLLFDEVKIKTPFESFQRNIQVEEDYNSKRLSLPEKLLPPTTILPEVKQKEELHKKMITKFFRMHKENPEFKFGEVAILGLIANLNEKSIDQVVKQAKELHKYNGYLYQLLRTLVASPSKTVHELTEVEELKARANNIVHSLDFLTQQITLDGKPITIHEFLTDNGQHLENLVFFAACFGNELEVTIDQLKELKVKIDQLDEKLKDQLLDNFAAAKLPFAKGSINQDVVLTLKLGDLGSEESLIQIIDQAKFSKISYEFETRFNEVSRSTIRNVKPDFNIIESKYNVKFNDALKAKSFAELKQEIIKDPSYIRNNLGNKNLSESIIKEIEFEFVSEMFASLSPHEKGWASLHVKAMQLLSNSTKPITSQLSDIEYNKDHLDELLKHCDTLQDKTTLLDTLLQEPLIGYDILKGVLVYLSSISVEKIHEFGLTLSEFLHIIPKSLLIKNFSLFRTITDFVLQNTQGFALKELYELTKNVSDIKNSEIFFAKILQYCQNNNDFSILKFVASLNSHAKNFEKIIEWLTELKPEVIKQLSTNSHINLKQLFKIADIEKIKSLADIALNFGTALTKQQYKAIIEHVSKHDLDEAKLLKSYFLSPEAIGMQEGEKIALIMDNLHSLEKVQTIFSEFNLERFSYNVERVTNKIIDIAHKQGLGHDKDIPLLLVEQKELYKCFITVMELCRKIKDFNYNELHDRSVELKHIRALHKDDNPGLIRNLDLEFVALTIEAMYREIGKFPRDIQILSLLNTIIHDGHLIAEVATGQGKSIIAALHASYLWFTGQTVDVATTSLNLAERDLEQFSPFYDAVGVKHCKAIITPASSADSYIKAGVNYGVASDLALFRADREFHSNKRDNSLNSDVSIICDEIDATLTSDVNFKLALPLANTNNEETRVLFTYILDFASIAVFKSRNVSRQEDVENLKLYLNYQFEKYDSSLHFPLTPVQLAKIKKTEDQIAQKLYTLNQALVKCLKDRDKLFDKLLDAVAIAKHLEKGVHFVVLPLDDQGSLKAIPIVKNQPSKDTVFGDGVHAFLHLLLEQENPEWSMRFQISPPTATIFNVSPKNFFDYYSLTSGRIIGLTGTAGSPVELEEFLTVNKIVAYAIPPNEADQKIILPAIETNNQDEQYSKILEIIRDMDSDRPVLVFCASTKHAEELYNLLKDRGEVQLCASSPHDTNNIAGTINNAGTKGAITITTPMLGRGTDFFTSHPDGYLAVNLCTDITYSSLWQIYGRVARNGSPGTVISIFNRDVYADNVETYEKHMELVAGNEKGLRERSQPLTDVLKYFCNANRDNSLNAILTNEFITKSWNILLAANDKMSSENKKSMSGLRDELVKIVKDRYPEMSKNLDVYLELVDSSIPESLYAGNHNITLHNITTFIVAYQQGHYDFGNYRLLEDSFSNQEYSNALDVVPGFTKVSSYYTASYVVQDDIPCVQTAIDSTVLSWKKDASWKVVENLASSVPSFSIPKFVDNTKYKTFYQYYTQVSNVKMLTHAFTLEKEAFEFLTYYKIRFATNMSSKDDLGFDEIIFSISNGKLMAHLKAKEQPILITSKDDDKNGLPLKLVNKIKSYQTTEKPIPFNKTEMQDIRYYLLQKEKMNYKFYVRADGSSGSLMLDEFKRSFDVYRIQENSTELNKIGQMVDNFRQIQDLDFTKLEYGKYQAIRIITKFTSSGSHVESILTDGKFLFWLNRGGGAHHGSGLGDGTGIKIFKIIRDIVQVQAVLESLKVEKSQADTRKAIFSLLREDDDKDVPNHVLVEMEPQKIGNCGWTQTKAMLKALAIVGHIGELEILPDIESQEWQKAIKDANDIYKDFTTFDRMIRAEALVYSIDATFDPKFLDAEQRLEINKMRHIVDEPVTQELLESLVVKLESTSKRYINTIYEDQYHLILKKLQLEAALGSKMGIALQYVMNDVEAKKLLKKYQDSYLGNFDDLNKIYETIKHSRLESEDAQKELFKQVIHYVMTQSIQIVDIKEFTENLTSIIKECMVGDNVEGNCIEANFVNANTGDDIINGGLCITHYHEYNLEPYQCAGLIV